MSLDTHKYGYALKGTSVVLYRHRALLRAQYFCFADWTGGLYTTPTLLGSRSGGLIAQTWASMVSLGMSGYERYTREIVTTTRSIAQGIIQHIPELMVLGDIQTLSMIICFTTTSSSKLNIYQIADKLHALYGWHIKSLQHPACLHFCITTTQIGSGERFLADLKATVAQVKESGGSGEGGGGGTAAIYGMTAALPPGPVNELLKVYNDVILKP